MSSDSDTPIHLHAELLPNIRQLTFYVSLPTGSYISQDGGRLKPEISLPESRRAVTVSVGGDMETMKLPARVSESSRSGLRFPEHAFSGNPAAIDGTNRMEFSFRMQVDKDEVPGLTKDGFVDDFIPWTAADMSTSALVRCRECSAVILDPGEHTEGWTWKDLPSGNWAEMMDFWHCHKPDPHEGHDHKSIEDSNAVLKGYGAANQISASPGTVLVDVASFLVAEVDCNGLRKVRGRFPVDHCPSLLWVLHVPCTMIPESITMSYSAACRIPRYIKTSLPPLSYHGQQEGGLLHFHDLASDTIARNQSIHKYSRSRYITSVTISR